MANLLQELNEKTAGSLAKHSADFLGEDITNTNSAVSGTYSTLIASLIQKGSEKDGAKKIFKMVEKADAGILDTVDRIFTRSPQTVNGLVNVGTRDIPNFVGSKHREASNLIAKDSGIGKESSAKLMRLSSPFLLGMLGKHVSDGNLDEAGLLNLINGQKGHVESMMPTDMKETLEMSSFGWVKKEPVKEVKKPKKKKVKKEPKLETVDHTERVAKEKVVKQKKKAAPVVQQVAEETGGGIMSIFKWLLPILAIGALAWFLLTRLACGGVDVPDVKSVANNVVAKTENVATAVKDKTVSALGAVNDAALKALDGIKFTAGSAGSQMMAFIKGGGKGEGKFRFTNLNFASGSATITGTSGVEVDNLAAILKAYPDVKVSIEGYTDSKGNPDSNQRLSQQRAEAVSTKLVAQGIDVSRIKTQGFGAANPVATNDTAEGRAQNRRIEVVIVK